jgi:hypothetical protein
MHVCVEIPSEDGGLRAREDHRLSNDAAPLLVYHSNNTHSTLESVTQLALGRHIVKGRHIAEEQSTGCRRSTERRSSPKLE